MLEKRKELIKQLKIHVKQNDFNKFKRLCNYLRQNHIHYLGYLLEKNNDEDGHHSVKNFPKKYLDKLEEKFESPTTLARMFKKYNFPPIKFLYPELKFKQPIELLEISRTYFGDGVIPKNHQLDEIHNFFDENYKNPFLYPDVLNIDFQLKEFYLEKMPMNYYTSARQPQRSLAEIFYFQIISTNKYSGQEIDDFRKNNCVESNNSDDDSE
jgi:hypothetical protein